MHNPKKKSRKPIVRFESIRVLVLVLILRVSKYSSDMAFGSIKSASETDSFGFGCFQSPRPVRENDY